MNLWRPGLTEELVGEVPKSEHIEEKWDPPHARCLPQLNDVEGLPVPILKRVNEAPAESKQRKLEAQEWSIRPNNTTRQQRWGCVAQTWPALPDPGIAANSNDEHRKGESEGRVPASVRGDQHDSDGRQGGDGHAEQRQAEPVALANDGNDAGSQKGKNKRPECQDAVSERFEIGRQQPRKRMAYMQSVYVDATPQCPHHYGHAVGRAEGYREKDHQGSRPQAQKRAASQENSGLHREETVAPLSARRVADQNEEGIGEPRGLISKLQYAQESVGDEVIRRSR